MRLGLATVYAAGVAQGVALVTFPAASAVLTGPDGYGLSSTRYGALFLPQALAAVAASLAGAALGRRLAPRRILRLGLLCGVASMALLAGSWLAPHREATAHGLLLVATGLLGAGFGLAVPAMNTLAAQLVPDAVDRAVLLLNALLGVGTALAPVLWTLFADAGAWWGLPLAVGAALLVLGGAAGVLPARGTPASHTGDRRLPALLWLFAGFALLYGVVETLSGNWATLYMTGQVGASATTASLALTVFWGSVTAGRVLFAALSRRLPPPRVYRVLPLLSAAALALLALRPVDAPGAGVALFAAAGVGCSALLPLTISFGQARRPSRAASIAGTLVAFYQVGYGIAAFGAGPLQARLDLPLRSVFWTGTAASLALAAIAPVIAPRKGDVAA